MGICTQGAPPDPWTPMQGQLALSEGAETPGRGSGLCPPQKPRPQPWLGPSSQAGSGCGGSMRAVGTHGGSREAFALQRQARVRACLEQDGDAHQPSPSLVAQVGVQKSTPGYEHLLQESHPQRDPGPRRGCTGLVASWGSCRTPPWADALAPQTSTRRDGTHPQPRWPRGSQTSLQKETRCQGWAGPRYPPLFANPFSSLPSPSYSSSEDGPILQQPEAPGVGGASDTLVA